MRQLYDQATLDRISSQNKLDKMVRIVTPSAWISILGAAAIVGCLVVWGLKGSIPTKENGSGVYMNKEGLYGQYTNISGTLLELKVGAGDMVQKGDVLGMITSDEYFKLEQLDERIAGVENITFDSEFDVVTQDTKELAEIKREANKPNTEIQSIETNLDIKKQRFESLSTEVDSKKAEMLSYKQKYYETLALDDPTAELKYNESSQDLETNRSVFESMRNNYLSSEEDFYQQKKQFNAKYRHFDYDAASEEEQRQYDAEYEALQAAADTAEDYNYIMEDAQARYNSANEDLETARTDYLTQLGEAAKTKVENSIAYNEYSELLTAYNTLLSEYKTLSSEISELEIRLVVSRAQELADLDSYSNQFDNQKAAILSSLEADRQTCINEIRKESITANISGMIYRIDAEVGAGVTKGEKLVTIFPAGGKEQACVLCYVPYEKIPELEPGQAVHITPSGMNPNEYGYIFGTIVSINNFIESEESMMEKLNNQDLIRQMTAEGPVVAVQEIHGGRFCCIKK